LQRKKSKKLLTLRSSRRVAGRRLLVQHLRIAAPPDFSLVAARVAGNAGGVVARMQTLTLHVFGTLTLLPAAVCSTKAEDTVALSFSECSPGTHAQGWPFASPQTDRALRSCIGQGFAEVAQNVDDWKLPLHSELRAQKLRRAFAQLQAALHLRYSPPLYNATWRNELLAWGGPSAELPGEVEAVDRLAVTDAPHPSPRKPKPAPRVSQPKRRLPASLEEAGEKAPCYDSEHWDRTASHGRVVDLDSSGSSPSVVAEASFPEMEVKVVAIMQKSKAWLAGSAEFDFGESNLPVALELPFVGEYLGVAFHHP